MGGQTFMAPQVDGRLKKGLFEGFQAEASQKCASLIDLERETLGYL